MKSFTEINLQPDKMKLRVSDTFNTLRDGQAADSYNFKSY